MDEGEQQVLAETVPPKVGVETRNLSGVILELRLDAILNKANLGLR